MFNKPPPAEVLRALANLQNDRDFACVLDWLRDARAEIAHAMAHQKDDHVAHQQQGAYQTVDKFLEHATNANQSINKAAIRRPSVYSYQN